MSLVHTLLLFDGSGRITTLNQVDFPEPNFNGGTPAGDLGSLVIAAVSGGFLPKERLGGLTYSDGGALLVDGLGAIDHWNAGLPLTAIGALCISTLNPASWTPGGIPVASDGRVSLAPPTPPINLSGYDGGYDTGFG